MRKSGPESSPSPTTTPESEKRAPERVQTAARWIARHWKGATALGVGTIVAFGAAGEIHRNQQEDKAARIERAYDTIDGATNDVFILRPGVNLRTDPSINNDKSMTNVEATAPEDKVIVVYGAGRSPASPGWIAFRAPREAALSGPNEETNRQEALNTVWVNIDAIEGSDPDLITSINVIDPAAGTQENAEFGIDYATSDAMTPGEATKLENFLRANSGPTQGS